MKAVSVLFSEPKISQSSATRRRTSSAGVSVLFSEPKISQSSRVRSSDSKPSRFSALQRAENFSIAVSHATRRCGGGVSVLFSEPKISQFQNAEEFVQSAVVSVLFSEPKISQLRIKAIAPTILTEVSVLFSEPKISQFTQRIDCAYRSLGFSALQRAENFSIHLIRRGRPKHRAFQCSSASRKFLNQLLVAQLTIVAMFQCSSASRKFLNFVTPQTAPSPVPVSVLFSEPKISQ